MIKMILILLTVFTGALSFAQNLKCTSGANELILETYNKTYDRVFLPYRAKMEWAVGRYGFYAAECAIIPNDKPTIKTQRLGCSIESNWLHPELVAIVDLAQDKKTATIYEPVRDKRTKLGFRLEKTTPLKCEPTTETAR